MVAPVVKHRDETVRSAWPSLIALTGVVLLATGLMVFDVVRDLDTEDRTDELVHNALQSITLADDLRREVDRLAAAGTDRDAAMAARAQIARDRARYDPLATYPDERGEWTHLQDLLGRLTTSTRTVDPALLTEVDRSLDRIVKINNSAAAANVVAIHAGFRMDYTIDVIGSAIVIVLAVFIGAALLHSIRRYRALLATHLAMKDQRQGELEAFAGRVAHDLRGPLAPLRGYADLLRVGDGPSPEELGRRIASSTDRMAAIIDDLLTLSTSGHPEPGEAELAEVISLVLDDSAPQLADARVRRAIIDARARCPRAALCRIVHNLVSNAIKYRSPDRQLELGITVTRRGSIVELVVSDNGVGMDEATAARAFDPLYRGTATRMVPGHGLGLAIVQRTVEASGGSCSIASTLGEGTRVTVELPAA